MATGKVYLVGAGPGDAGLITVRGRRCLAQADAIVIDHLAPARLLRYARDDAEVYDVGKVAGRHPVPQVEIEALLIRLARRGLTVVRLKGGDPFVFGRGGEEALALEAAGVPWEMVPGITSAVAVPAYAGIPVTHRRVSPSFTVVTGHQCAGRGDGDSLGAEVDWSLLGKTGGTLVILMGVGQLPAIVERLTAAGRSPETPAAVIRWGTRAEQRIVRGRLADIAERVREAGLGAPAVIVVGAVAGMPDTLAWFERQPLFGQRIAVVAQRREAAVELAESLEAFGAEAVDLPLQPYTLPERRAISRLLDERWAALYFSSVLGVDAVFSMMLERGLDTRLLAGVRVAAADTVTADALRRWGIRADFVAASPAEGEAWCRAAAEDERVFVETVGTAHVGPVAQVASSHLWRSQLYSIDTAALRERAERMLADVDDVRIDAVWVDSAVSHDAWCEVAGTWSGVPKDTPVFSGDVNTLCGTLVESTSAATPCRLAVPPEAMSR